MNASQANLVAQVNNKDARKEMMTTVFACIHTAAKSGKFETTYNFGTNEELTVVSEELSKLGYKVYACPPSVKPIKVSQLTELRISWE